MPAKVHKIKKRFTQDFRDLAESSLRVTAETAFQRVVDSEMEHYLRTIDNSRNDRDVLEAHTARRALFRLKARFRLIIDQYNQEPSNE